jgi:23S rRNA (guanosine2251-2'-O)-methyltransferase
MTREPKPFRQKPRRPGRPETWPRRAAGPVSAEHVIYGLHPVAAAFANPARVRHRLVATTNAQKRLAESGTAIDVPIEEASSNAINRLVGDDAVHQGCVLFCDPLLERELDDLQSATRLLLLDQVTDPHNVGAVLRSAAAFAVDAVIVTERHSPRETPVLAKSAAGALDVVPLIRVRNLSGTIEDLKTRGFATVGLDAGASAALDAIPLTEPFALVLGAEGKGLRQKTGETCSILARIAMPGRMPSLNVSNAAVLALYIADRAAGGN